jgi:transcription-repair coupling factor (superfamily II helicase)
VPVRCWATISLARCRRWASRCTPRCCQRSREIAEGGPRTGPVGSPLGATTEIKLHLPALLPADYCGDVHERLTLYKRLASCERPDALEAVQEELVDRFGKLPDPARALIETHRLRIQSQPLGIVRIDAAGEAIAVQFMPQPPIPPERIIKFLQSRRDARLAGPDRLRLSIESADLTQRVQRIREVLKALS